MVDLLYKEEVYAVVGAAMAVYNELGPGFLEAVYQEALEIELGERSIAFVAQPNIPVYYKGRKLKKFYLPDLLVCGKIIVALKAESRLTSADEAQLLNQLKVTGLELGLLINFGAEDRLDWLRRVNSKKPVHLPFEKICEDDRSISGD